MKIKLVSCQRTANVRQEGRKLTCWFLKDCRPPWRSVCWGGRVPASAGWLPQQHCFCERSWAAWGCRWALKTAGGRRKRRTACGPASPQSSAPRPGAGSGSPLWISLDLVGKDCWDFFGDWFFFSLEGRVQTLTAEVQLLTDAGRPGGHLPPLGAQTFWSRQFGGRVKRLHLHGCGFPRARAAAESHLRRRGPPYDLGVRRGQRAQRPSSGGGRGRRRGARRGWRKGRFDASKRRATFIHILKLSWVQHAEPPGVPGEFHVERFFRVRVRKRSGVVHVFHLNGTKKTP